MRRLLLLLVAMVLLMPQPVAAQDVPRLASQLTDQTGVLKGSEATITTALSVLQRDYDVQLWVLFVATTGGTGVTDYVDEVARVNSLGVNDALLVVAIDDRTDAIWVSDGLAQITTAEIDQIIGTGVEPRLAAGDFAGAVTAAAAALGAAAVGTITPTAAPATAVTGPSVAPTTAPSPSPTPDAAGGILLPILAALLIVIGAYIVFLVVLRRRSEHRTAEERDRRTGDLARRVNHDLIEADEAVRDAQQELGFVEAQFGDADVIPFRDSVAKAADEVKAAFVVRQQLDDEVPEDPVTRERMLGRIATHLDVVRGLLAAQEQRLESLRDQQRRAPEVLTQLAEQVGALADRLAAGRSTLGRLTAYAPGSWQSIKGNAAEAEKRLDFARGALDRGKVALGSPNGPNGLNGPNGREVARSIRDTQGALGEATGLVDAIERMAASLDDARDRLPAELDAAAADVEAARRALGDSPSPNLTARLANAAGLLAAARAAAVAGPPDVLEAFRSATQANAAADAIVASVREEAARVARHRAVVAGAMRSATIAVDRANDYVATRRGGIGREARTRLVEAQRQLEQADALRDDDPDAAVQAAQRAQSLADEAYRLASGDFDLFDQRGPTGGTAGADLAGAIIGGILGGILSSGGRRGGWGGGGWGRTPWGSSGKPGGFGGGGRTIGGSWGGLGGRSRGGRW